VGDLVALLKQSGLQPHLADLSASIIARCCETKNQQMAFSQSGAIPLLVQMLCSGHPKMQESSLDAIGAIGRGNPELVKTFIDYPLGALIKAGKGDATIMSLIIGFLHDKRPSMRLIAATCLANFHHCGGINRVEDVVMHVLPTLVKLFDESSQTIREKAPMIFGYLVSDSEALQKAASEMDAITKLAGILTTLSKSSEVQDDCESESGMNHQNRLKESALIALGAVCSLREECRKQVIDARVLPIIVQCMESPHVSIRTAACQCTRSLSRSVKNLRTSLVDAGIALPLFKLLSDPSVVVQTAASATLCNIVLDFSPMKKVRIWWPRCSIIRIDFA
jgi:hypothetical protein